FSRVNDGDEHGQADEQCHRQAKGPPEPRWTRKFVSLLHPLPPGLKYIPARLQLRVPSRSRKYWVLPLMDRFVRSSASLIAAEMNHRLSLSLNFPNKIKQFLLETRHVQLAVDAFQ